MMIATCLSWGSIFSLHGKSCKVNLAAGIFGDLLQVSIINQIGAKENGR